MAEDHRSQALENDFVSPENSPASKTEQIQALVNGLCKNYQETNRGKTKRSSSRALSDPVLPGHNLELYSAWLAEAHSYFRESSHQKSSPSYAAEWVLDNYYMLRQVLQQIKKDLPAGYYRQLPKLIDGPLQGFPRIYAIGRAVLFYQNFLLDPIDLQTILLQFQEIVPLSMGELWALPIFLRYSLIEFLAHTLVLIIRPINSPHLPVLIPQMADVKGSQITGETYSGETKNDDGIPNIILSLKAISEQDWSKFFESISCLERTLRKDPAGIYPLMDFKTRDLYRKEIEVLSFATGRDENELAEITLNLARSSVPNNSSNLLEGAAGTSSMVSGSPSGGGVSVPSSLPYEYLGIPQVTHVGEYLLGKKRATLEQVIGYRPDVKSAFRRWVFRHAQASFLSGILFLTILILLALVLAVHLSGNLIFVPQSNPIFPWAAGLVNWSDPFKWIAVLLLGFTLMIPVLTVATSLVNWLITLMIRPHILPKLDFTTGIPGAFQTLVVIPAMITNNEEVDSLIHQLELHYLRNPEPGLRFALLTDFRDADHQSLPEDKDLLQYAVTKIENLNKKYTSLPSDQNEDDSPVDRQKDGTKIFFFLHRKRLWNPSEGKWIGWERKRGKLHELNLLLRGGANLSFIALSEEMRASENPLQDVRFVITPRYRHDSSPGCCLPFGGYISPPP